MSMADRLGPAWFGCCAFLNRVNYLRMKTSLSHLQIYVLVTVKGENTKYEKKSNKISISMIAAIFFFFVLFGESPRYQPFFGKNVLSISKRQNARDLLSSPEKPTI